MARTALEPGELQQFTGTEHYYRHFGGVTYTDGMKYVAEKCGAYWLIDLIASWQVKVKGEEFQVWSLEKDGERGYIAVCEDGNGGRLAKQALEYTDFPEALMPFKCWLVSGVLMLPSEY